MVHSRWQGFQSVCCHSTEDRKCVLGWPHKHTESNGEESWFQNRHHYILSIEQLYRNWISMWFSLEALQKFQFGSTFNLQRQITTKAATPVRMQHSSPPCPKEKLTATWVQNTEHCGDATKQKIQVFQKEMAGVGGGVKEWWTGKSTDFF